MTDASPQRHGGLRPAELRGLGLDPARILDFSASISPLGPPAGVAQAVARAQIADYPDPDCTDLVRALSAHLDVPAEQILPGNGSTELIHLVTRVFVRQGQRPIVLAPTFSEYETATLLAGGHIYPWHAQAHRQFRWTLKNKPDVLRRVAPPLVFLCNPNNPTGVYLGRDEVRSLSAALVSGPLLLDEAYIEFVEQPWRSLDLVEKKRVIVLRSMTKDYALAGLRIGYLVAHPDVIAAVRRLQPEWSVSSVAQAAAITALRDSTYLPRVRAVVRAGKQALLEGLEQLGLPVHGGEANFVLAEVGNATALRLELLQRGFAVRDCSSFGLPRHIRIGVRAEADCRRLLPALAAALADLPPSPPLEGIDTTTLANAG